MNEESLVPEQDDGLDARIRALVDQMAPPGAPPADLSRRLVQDLGYDSVALIELAFVLESELKLPAIKEDATLGVETVSDLVELVRSITGGGTAHVLRAH